MTSDDGQTVCERRYSYKHVPSDKLQYREVNYFLFRHLKTRPLTRGLQTVVSTLSTDLRRWQTPKVAQLVCVRGILVPSLKVAEVPSLKVRFRVWKLGSESESTPTTLEVHPRF
eukprot:scaffold5708_cov142-Cylindrotheca_fusiformis.AAC.2